MVNDAPATAATVAEVSEGSAAAVMSVPSTRERTWDADEAVTQIYAAHYRSLVRLSALLVRDVQAAEEIVQESFIAMHRAWRRLRDPDRALAYLRQAVVNRSRSWLRHRAVTEKHAPRPLPDAASAEDGAMTSLEHQAVLGALRTLPERQREVLVLRYYADLSEAEIAETIGVSRGAVKSHASRGLAAVRTTLEQTS